MKGLAGYRATDCQELLSFFTATSPADFWSKWNPSMHNAYYRLLKFMRRAAGTKFVVMPTMLFIFVFNGVWHDLLVVRLIFGDTGFPFTIFFSLQFVAVAAERTLKLRAGFFPAIFKTILTYCWLIASWKVACVISDGFFS